MNNPSPHFRLFLLLLFFFAFLVGLGGCATYTPEEREWRQGIDAENWTLCQLAYRQAGKPTWSKHDHRRHLPHRSHEIAEDLMVNNCRMVLGEQWIDY